MKRVFTFLLVSFFTHSLFAQCNESQLNAEYNWGSWKQASGYSFISYRVCYFYHNTSIARSGSRSHLWNYEIKNNSSEEVKLRYAITDRGADPKYGVTYLSPGEVKSSYEFTNTSCGGTVMVWIEATKQ